MKDVNMIYEWGMRIVRECGIKTGKIVDVTINTRAKKRWGQCKYNRSTNTYTININAEILADDVPFKPVLETMIHEILHTCEGCFNHGKEWKRMADIVRTEKGYNITRCTGAENFGIERTYQKKANYVLVCEKCGKEFIYQRLSKAVQNPHRYHCPCGGKIHLDEDKSIKMLPKSNKEMVTLTINFKHE